MNTYIQNKLDEFKKKYPDMKSENDEYTAIQTVDFIEEYLTDYHNHIVEILEKERQTWAKESIGEIAVKSIMARLQDTNPKE